MLTLTGGPNHSFEVDRDRIIAENPLLPYCEAHGWQLKRDGRQWKCLCPLHEERTPSFTIDAGKRLWTCFGCGKGGSVIDLHAELNCITIAEAMRSLSRDSGNRDGEHGASGGKGGNRQAGARSQDRANSPAHAPPYGAGVPQKPFSVPDSQGEPTPRETACYDYQDATGRVVFQVVRYEPKDFRQCRIVGGERAWNMDGVERLPYRLPELLSHPSSVWVLEGERDVETLRAIGQTATCNPGGAGKWLPAFSQYLRGKCVYLAPDNDEPGQKHMRSVLESLSGMVEWVRWVELPRELRGSPVKDMSDLRDACKDADDFFLLLAELQSSSRLIERGVESRGRTVAELEAAYIASMRSCDESMLMLGNWLPALGVRPLGSGDLLGIVADTGQLKSAALLNILACNAQLPAVVFSLELGELPMFERIAAISASVDAERIENTYREGGRVDWRRSGRFKNAIVYTDAVTMRDIDEEIWRSSAKLGCPPKIVAIDYVQLTDGAGSRYERVSDACEAARRLAKKHHVVVILVSQVSRKQGDQKQVREVSLHDAKESGSFENSCSLVLGLWKTSKTTMRCRVLKSSRGLSGNTVEMTIRGGTYIIDPAQ